MLLIALSTGCHRKQADSAAPADELSLSTSGKVTMYVDESFQPLLSSAETTFEHIYKNADVTFRYVTEAEAVQRFLNYETPVTFLARRLTNSELKDRKERGFVVQQLVIAKDAVAFVVNATNPDSLLTQRQAIDLLSAKTNNWNQLSTTNPSGNVNVVFQKNNSSTATFIRDSVLKGNALPQNSYALNTHKEVLDYVKKNTGALAVVALNWVSDADDPEVAETLSGVRVLSISSSAKPDAYYKPNLASIRENRYPFTRSMYMINGEGRTGLGTGFASYLASDPGMTLIERFGLVPYKDPVRVIETRKSFE
jgi:phosphate transport system substrate-binding protein